MDKYPNGHKRYAAANRACKTEAEAYQQRDSKQDETVISSRKSPVVTRFMTWRMQLSGARLPHAVQCSPCCIKKMTASMRLFTPSFG